jgi:hypothetical protein
VFSELCARFDTRTVAGRHVVHDHMLKAVRQHDDAQWRRSSRYDLVIDAHGILRKGAGFGRSWKKFRAEVFAWASRRVCAKTFHGWWWFRIEPIGAACEHRWQCHLRGQHFWVAGVAFHGLRLTSAGAMTPKQIRYLEQLPDDLRGQFVIASPWR